MRGIGADKSIIRLLCGITPAYAGNSSQESERPYGAWDYPCVCGE